ncbi:hypothetical protein PUR61_30465 [Streptomyces sp. BE20]|uniref:hypothetical protein n=1 Tax=Streptomyces sp. BE20 TaxID=3002525 RepID=UPI002E7661FB|nr:hypothetical protein [Streptomyces sp. BE20]MEE1826479.1 hypothetical protein [Streptomyces sp. BE20]
MSGENQRTNRTLPGFERWMLVTVLASFLLFVGFHLRGTVEPLTDWRSLAAGALFLTIGTTMSYASDRKVGIAVVIGIVNGYAAAGIVHQFL